MIVPGGTPSVSPVSTAVYAGLPPAITFNEVDPGSVETTVVQGFVLGLGGCAQPTIGEPTRSGSQSTGAPPAITCICFGITTTWPPCAQMIVALLLTSGGIPVRRVSRAGRAVTSRPPPLTPPGKSGIFEPPRKGVLVLKGAARTAAFESFNGVCKRAAGDCDPQRTGPFA